MRFLKLLDPFSKEPQFQATARERFPEMVSESVFNYWTPEQLVSEAACRVLTGVAAGFSLPSLRLLDLISDKIEQSPSDIVVDVFDLDDADSPEELRQYFVNFDLVVQPPIVGIWKHGKHERNLSGHAAMQFLIETFELGLTPAELMDSVRPPTPEMMEG